MIVFVVSFVDEMERSLARLFLQQLQMTQTKVALTPHCEFRRPNDVTKELLKVVEDCRDDNMLSPVGYLSLSFFSANVATEERRQKAVELLVDFLPYMDSQVKHTKAMMLSTMRKKKKKLFSPGLMASSQDVLTTKDKPSRYFDDVRNTLSNALGHLAESARDMLDGNAAANPPTVEMENSSATTQLIAGRQKIPLLGSSDEGEKLTKQQEQCLIESSTDSLRVSFLFKQQSTASSNPLEASILYQWMRFFQQEAEEYKIVRRKAVDEYSISFLILNQHVRLLGAKTIENWILKFCGVLDRECSEIKIQVNAQARIATTEFFKAF